MTYGVRKQRPALEHVQNCIAKKKTKKQRYNKHLILIRYQMIPHCTPSELKSSNESSKDND
jgi:hypothetical protein